MKAFCITLICLGTLLLVVYPFMLMANLMALAAIPAAGADQDTTMLRVYLWVSTLYPVAYLIALVGSIWCLKKSSAAQALWWQAGYFAYLVLIVGLLLSS